METTDIAQQTLKVVDRTFKSFYGLINAVRNGSYQQKVKLPNYLPKEGYFLLIIPCGWGARKDKKTGVKTRVPRLASKDGKFRVPMSNEFKREYGEVWIPFPKRIQYETLKEIRVHPKYNAQFFEVEFIQEVEETPVESDPDIVMAIDFGIDNLATCTVTTGASFILDGKPLKSFNQWFNKRNAGLQSIKDKQGIKDFTKQQAKLTQQRNDQVRDYLNKAVRYIANYCIENKVSHVVVGYNPGIKQGINIGKSNNQKFVQIPYHSFRLKLQAMRYGLIYQEQEESYTSRASALDGDALPTYNAAHPQAHQFSGKRVKRGLYRTKDGHLVNADANGSWNIGHKSKLNGFLVGECRAALTQPRRINLLKLERKRGATRLQPVA